MLVGDGHDGAQPVVRHRNDANRHLPCPTDLVGDLGERGTLGEAGRTEEVGREVAISEIEPARRCRRPVGSHRFIPFERLHRPPRLADEPPAALGVDGPGQGVGDGVEIRRDRQAVQRAVVTGVHDGRDVPGAVDVVEIADGVDQAREESGGADAARDDGDPSRDVGRFRIHPITASPPASSS